MGSRRNPGTHRETRLNRPWFRPENVKILIPVWGSGQLDLEGLLWGQKVLETSAHSISSPRPTPRMKKCPGTNEGNPDCQNVLPRMTLSSAGQNHGRGSPRQSPWGSQKIFQALWASHRSMVERQPQEKLSPPY